MAPYNKNPKDPLHGITLENILNQLVLRHGWIKMGQRIPVRCFQYNPTIKSSLTFLRKTPWARKRVEDWFISGIKGRQDAGENTENRGTGH
jgi:uncharacterized protein (DUF2132 family)